MIKSGLWATEIELFATEHLLKTYVYIYGQSGKTFFRLKFSAKFFDPTVVFFDEFIYLNHKNGFDLIVCVLTPLSTIFHLYHGDQF